MLAVMTFLFLFPLAALLYGSAPKTHPRHIGSIDPNTDVAAVVAGESIIIQIDLAACTIRWSLIFNNTVG